MRSATDGPWIGLHPLGQYEREEDGEAEDKEVSRRIEVDELEIREAGGGDHAEHDAEDAADDRLWDGDEKGAEFGEGAEKDHHEGGRLDHPPATHFRHSYGPDVLRVARRTVARSPQAGQDAADSFYRNPAIHRVYRWPLGSGQSGARVVVTDALDCRRQNTRQHSENGRRAHRR